MAGVTGQFAEALNRKYDIQQQGADSESQLRAAQAQGITGSLASENALRNAQAYTTSQQGQQVAPLAQASISATQAGVGETQARAGLYGAQAGQIGFDTFGPATAAERGNYYDQSLYPNANGLGGAAARIGGGQAPVTGSLSTPVGGATSTQNNFSITDPADAPWRKLRPNNGFAAGTADVPAKGTNMKAPAGKNSKPMGPGNGTQVTSPPPIGSSLIHPNGMMNLHGIMAHAIAAVHAAGGMTDVPAPGQTVSNGSWAGPTAPPPAPAPLPPTPAMGTDLRRRLGMGVKAAGGATSINAQGGAAKVPGKGAPNVDSVKAELAPHEAVLNAGAASHMGRGAIAALNALGAAKMAQAGMPPATPPTAHGTPAQMSARTVKPVARGMPPAKPKAKAPPAKVAAGGARR